MKASRLEERLAKIHAVKNWKVSLYFEAIKENCSKQPKLKIVFTVAPKKVEWLRASFNNKSGNFALKKRPRIQSFANLCWLSTGAFLNRFNNTFDSVVKFFLKQRRFITRKLTFHLFKLSFFVAHGRHLWQWGQCDRSINWLVATSLSFSLGFVFFFNYWTLIIMDMRSILFIEQLQN